MERGDREQNHDVLTRSTGYLTLRTDPVATSAADVAGRGLRPACSATCSAPTGLLRSGPTSAGLRGTRPTSGRTAIRSEHWAPFRYEMCNRSALVQEAIGHERILETIEPLIGGGLYVIANTMWYAAGQQQATHGGHYPGTLWAVRAAIPRHSLGSTRIPYPIFAVATHLYLQDCPLEAGPTGVIPRSHTSGQPPPRDRMTDDDLQWDGRGVVPLVAKAGDVALFVSDVWHRRQPPTEADPGRMFLQCHYGRRDLAQRLRPTSETNQLCASEAVEARDNFTAASADRAPHAGLLRRVSASPARETFTRPRWWGWTPGTAPGRCPGSGRPRRPASPRPSRDRRAGGNRRGRARARCTAG